MKKAERNEYSTPLLEVEELEVERGFGNSSFGVGSEEIGDLEELV